MRQKFGRFCHRHDDKMTKTGDPRGRIIRKVEVQPFVALAKAYIVKHQGHPKVAEALTWIERLIYSSGPAPAPRVKASPQDRVLRFLEKMRGKELDPVDALALVVAMFTYREFDPRQFRSDRHFWHQLAIRFLRQVTSGHKPHSKSGVMYCKYDGINVGVREYIGPALNRNLGVLSLTIARMIVAKIEAERTSPQNQLNNLLNNPINEGTTR
jgi:hypothetical protein